MRMTDPVLREGWLKQLESHSKFFLILTGVFGTVSGVGIWFAIGLTHPEATSTLIHNFVFGWAMEWVFFLVELTTVAVYYYTWNRMDPKLHLKVGWVYAGASAATLIIINGILTFMLTPGDTWLAVAGTGHEASKFWNAFFNPTYWPSLLLRTGVCTSLAGVWALITSSRIDGDKQPALKTPHGPLERQVARPLLRRHAFPAGVVPLHGPANAARPAHSGHRHHRRRHLLHRHPHRAHHHHHIGHHRRRRLLPGLSQPVGFNLSHAMAVLLLALMATGRANMRAKCSASRSSSAAGCTPTASAPAPRAHWIREPRFLSAQHQAVGVVSHRRRCMKLRARIASIASAVPGSPAAPAVAPQ